MPEIRIGLLWHSSASGNLGVGALTVGNIALVRQAAARLGLTPHFTIFGPRESGRPYVTGDDISHRVIDGRYTLSPSGYAADVRRQHIILDIGAGDSFTDIYTNRRFAYMSVTKLLALQAGVPLVFSPQTIGPFSRQPHTAIASWLMTRATRVFVRDPVSAERLASLSPRARGAQVIDVAFALPFDTPPPRTGGPLKIGLSVSGLLMSGGYGSANDYGLGYEFPTLIRRLVTSLTARPDTEVHLIAHVRAPHMPRDDDGRAIDALHAEFPTTIRAPDFASPSDAKTYIAGLDFLTGSRMHATIAAFSAGVAVVPISYSRKFEGLYGGLDYPHLVPAKGMDTDQAYAMVMQGIEDRARLAADIAAAQPGIQASLARYVDALVEDLGAARHRKVAR